ncbi:toxin-activating lysine-acyltransferase [uncultured Roseibium sp.]|uniref:toxin-activating lysine-acyltransferase n=1 Tax=uncultured Roseibium sp. TaxID=1936171 RepID=UPI002632FAD6|nr:toxin-activating lysine-acyltransferase [uncultured Roseibium sp.]
MNQTTHTGTESLPDFTVLGESLALMAQCDLYRSRSIDEFGELVLPPMRIGQFRIWRRQGVAVALATWAYLDADTEKAVLEEDAPLPPDCWATGNRPVVMDMVAPFGDGFAASRDLVRTVFPGIAFKAVRRAADGRPRRIVQFAGLTADGQKVAPSSRIAA